MGPTTAGPPQGDVAGWLFAYFRSEELPDGEQVRFALSEGDDPLRWTELRGGAPCLVSRVGERGARDPFLLRRGDGGGFVLLASDLRMHGSTDWEAAQRTGSRALLVWRSSDLVDWDGPERVEVAPPGAGNAWAPEAAYDAARGSHLVWWASSTEQAPAPVLQRVLCAWTSDFRTFTRPEVMVDPGHPVIDTTLVEHGGLVWRLSKDERPQEQGGQFLLQEVGRGLRDPGFRTVRRDVGRGVLARGEGPVLVRAAREDRWYLFVDEHGGGRGYVPLTTTDLAGADWRPVGEHALPPGARHGSVLALTAEEHLRLRRQPPGPARRRAARTVERLPDGRRITYYSSRAGS